MSVNFVGLLERVLIFAAVAISISANAQLLTAKCSEPAGTRFDFFDGELREAKDGFEGVNPQFVLSSSDQKRLTVIWPDTKGFGAAARQNAFEAIVVSHSPSMIVAIKVYEKRVDMITLFPKNGLAYMSTHREISAAKIVQNATQFSMKCVFEGQ